MGIRVGIIGCGSITKLRHAPEYKANPDCEITGFYDSVKERAVSLAREYDALDYSTIEELIADDSIDAVSVCTTNSTHAAITIAALEAGKHVLCEKPMTTSLTEARKMIDTAEKTGKMLMVAQNQRFVTAHIKAREIIASDILGNINSFRACFKHGGPEYWAIDKNNSTWYFDKNKVAIGVMGDLGIHKLDLIRYLMGKEIEAVLSCGATLEKCDHTGKAIGVDDTSFAIFKLEGGALGTMEVSWCNHGVMEDSVVMYCKNGVIRLQTDPEYPLVIEMQSGEKIRWDLPEPKNGSGVIDAFISSLVQGNASPVGGEDVMNSMAAIVACMESSRIGGWVSLKK